MTTLTADPEVCRFFDAMIHEYDDKELCKGVFAKDALGKNVFESDDTVVAICLTGCRFRVARKFPELAKAEDRVIEALRQTPNWTNSVHFNDRPETTKADVIAKIKEAKALAGCTD